MEPADISFHHHVLRALRDAQVVLDSWGGYLAVKYRLGADDRIDEDGVIQRVELH